MNQTYYEVIFEKMKLSSLFFCIIHLATYLQYSKIEWRIFRWRISPKMSLAVCTFIAYHLFWLKAFISICHYVGTLDNRWFIFWIWHAPNELGKHLWYNRNWKKTENWLLKLTFGCYFTYINCLYWGRCLCDVSVISHLQSLIINHRLSLIVTSLRLIDSARLFISANPFLSTGYDNDIS